MSNQVDYTKNSESKTSIQHLYVKTMGNPAHHPIIQATCCFSMTCCRRRWFCGKRSSQVSFSCTRCNSCVDAMGQYLCYILGYHMSLNDIICIYTVYIYIHIIYLIIYDYLCQYWNISYWIITSRAMQKRYQKNLKSIDFDEKRPKIMQCADITSKWMTHWDPILVYIYNIYIYGTYG